MQQFMIFLLVCLFRVTLLFNKCWLDYVTLYFNLICHFNIFGFVYDYNDYVTFGVIYQWNTRSRAPFFFISIQCKSAVHFVSPSPKICSSYFTVNMFIMELKFLLWFFFNKKFWWNSSVVLSCTVMYCLDARILQAHVTCYIFPIIATFSA